MRPGNIIVIGSSTGGPRILKAMFGRLPVLNAAIIIVQHFPKSFNKCFVEGLCSTGKMDVVLAEHGDRLRVGIAYFAPSEVHLQVVENERIQLVKGAPVNYVCPSIDVAMLSLGKVPGGRTVGVVLTGMGKDGAAGLAHIKEIGGATITQDEESSAVFSMPRAAIRTGKVDHVLPADRIPDKLVELVGVL